MDKNILIGTLVIILFFAGGVLLHDAGLRDSSRQVSPPPELVQPAPAGEDEIEEPETADERAKALRQQEISEDDLRNDDS
jgi:hypothetical protein